MKALIMMVSDFNNYEVFKEEILNRLPNVLELCYYEARAQHSALCERFSLEEFEMPCTIFRNGEEDATSGDVSNSTVIRATKYADVVVWFSHRSSVLGANTSALMTRLGKPVIHIQL